MHNEFDFYTKLKSPQSSNILESIKSFIDKDFKGICDSSDDLNDISFQFQEYISKLTYDFAKVWKIEFYEEKSIYSNIINGFENILCKVLYKKILNQFVDAPLNYEQLLFVSCNDLDIDGYFRQPFRIKYRLIYHYNQVLMYILQFYYFPPLRRL